MGKLSDLLPILMLLLGIAMAIVILMRRGNRYFRRRKKNKDQGPIVLLDRPETPSNRSALIMSDDLARQEVQLTERARELMGQLDSKIRVLQQLILQTQRQIERMESLLEQAEAKKQAEKQSSERGG